MPKQGKRKKFQPYDHRSFRAGIDAAADYIEGVWDGLVAATPYRLSDIVRLKFCRIGKKDVRKLYRRGKGIHFFTLPHSPAPRKSERP